jgi:hypothetical protein
MKNTLKYNLYNTLKQARSIIHGSTHTCLHTVILIKPIKEYGKEKWGSLLK